MIFNRQTQPDPIITTDSPFTATYFHFRQGLRIAETPILSLTLATASPGLGFRRFPQAIIANFYQLLGVDLDPSENGV